MSDPGAQQSLFEGPTPAARWEHNVAKRALDELFSLARRYRSGPEFRALMEFVRRFRSYSPFNAMLVHIQMPGAKYVAPASRWLRDHGRHVKAGAHPLVILQPMGPVMFVFDVSETVPREGAPRLPRQVADPFGVRGGRIGGQDHRTIANAKRDGVEVQEQAAGSQLAGSIRVATRNDTIAFEATKGPDPQKVHVPLRYELLLNGSHTREAQYATLAHELGHLYCGHLGTPNDRWWPDRRGLNRREAEFEAESVCYLVCGRLGIDNPSDQYLAGYVSDNQEPPPISLDCVMKAVTLIERMGREQMSPRKAKE